MLESAVKSNKDLDTIMSPERIDVAKGCAPMMFPQYVSLLKAESMNWMLWNESRVVDTHAISLLTTLSVMDKAAEVVAVVMMAAVEDASWWPWAWR